MTKFNLTYYHPSHFASKSDMPLRYMLFFANGCIFIFLGVILSHFLSHPIF